MFEALLETWDHEPLLVFTIGQSKTYHVDCVRSVECVARRLVLLSWTIDTSSSSNLVMAHGSPVAQMGGELNHFRGLNPSPEIPTGDTTGVWLPSAQYPVRMGQRPH